MIAVDTSLGSDVPALKDLWKQAFGDEESVIDLFFKEAYTPTGMFVLRDDGEIVAMAAWFPLTLCRQKLGWPAAYLYAVATKESARGRGHCRHLLEAMAGALEAQGIACLCLVPGSVELFDFYRKIGFVDEFCHGIYSVDTLADTKGTATAIDAPTYLGVREEFLQDTTYFSYPVPVLSYQKKAAQQGGGDLFLLEAGGKIGCACASLAGERANIHELLWPGDPSEGAALVCNAIRATSSQICTPGRGKPFGLLRWLQPPPPVLSPAYLGLAFD